MKKLVIALLTATLFFCATSAIATSFYYEATDVTGVGTVTYGYGAPAFTFLADEGYVDTNMGGFVAGNYTVDFALSGFSIEGYALPDFSFSLGAYDISALPLSGTQDNLTWNFDPYQGIYLSYDFGDTGTFTNDNVNAGLALIDYFFSGDANGIMDADISWDTLRVDLTDTAPVPEPSTLLLLGAGIAGLAFYRRKKS